MPNIVTGNEPQVDFGALISKDYSYEYPYGLDLKPGSELHTFIINQVLQKARESRTIMENRFDAWNSTDKKLTAYTPITQEEKDVKDADDRKPVPIVLPYSFAILETLMSYLVAAFFPEPIFRYEGSSPEDVIGATLMEKVISLHCNRLKVAIPLHTMFRDASAYGMGIVAPQWTVKRGKKVVKRETGFFDFMSRFRSQGWERGVEKAVLFEGNSLQNVDPYRYFPDPNVPVHEVQKGEFVGWLDESNLMNLLDEEKNDPDIFNVKYLHHVQNKRSSVYSTDASMRMEKSGGSFKDSTITKPVDSINMYFKLIPSTWNIGDGDYPEKWLFTVSADSVVIRAKRLDLNHDMFPVAVCAPDFDGYSPIATSRMEILDGMQGTLDWLMNSHIANVRKAINDMIIVDPYLVNMNDLKDPKPGKLIRLRRPAWGRGVDKVAQQLVVNDITKANMGDASLIIQYMQQIGGTDNPMMGSLRTGGPERLTKGEFQGTAMGAISRLERIAKMIGLQGMQDIGYMFAHHTQQFMTEETYVNTTGQWPEDIINELQPQRGRVKVTPWDVLVDYDLLVRDGSVPGGNFADVWTQLFQIIASQPALLQKFDIVRIFKHIARNVGAKNVEEFELKQVPQVQGQVMSDEGVAEGERKGDLVPI